MKIGDFTTYDGSTLYINWQLTRKCNYYCSYCRVYDNSTEFISLKNIEKAIKQIAIVPKEKYFITLTGGEPTIDPNYIELLKCLFSNFGEKVVIHTITNLSKKLPFYKKLINEINTYKTNLIFDTSYHFEFANFDRFIENCKFLSENSIKVSVGIMAHPEKMQEVKQLINEFEKIKNSYLTYKVKNIRQEDEVIDSRYNKQDLEWLQKFYDGIETKPIKLEFNSSIKYYSAPEIVANDMNHFKGMVCEAGVNNFTINYDGTVNKAVCFGNDKGIYKNIYKNDNVLVDIGSSPVICSHKSCGCLADIPIPKYFDDLKKRKLLDSYFNSLEQIINKYKILYRKEEFDEIISREMTNFYINKNYFNNLHELFKYYNLDDFAIKAQSVYYAHKAIEYRNSLVNISDKEDDIKNEFFNLCELFNNSIAKDNFIHYIKTHSLLHKINLTGIEYISNQILTSYLKKINWEYKEFLYNTLIKNIIKLNTEDTKASVIIISNGSENYIFETLLEINKQKNADYKIIFVSNNETNQTGNILNLVDTFIQMKDNSGAYLARNVGSIFGFSEILIFLEDDGIPEKDFVKNHIAIHQNKYIISVRGVYLTKTNGNMPAHYWLGNSEKPAPTMLEGNCSFKAKQFYAIGGWGDYIMFGHGGVEICHRFLKKISQPNQHIYSPKPIIYHDWIHEHKNIKRKKIIQHASWQVLKFSYDDFHDILKNW